MSYNHNPVFKQVTPGDRAPRNCLLSQMVPLQLVGKVPGRAVPFVLWDNKVGQIMSPNARTSGEVAGGLQLVSCSDMFLWGQLYPYHLIEYVVKSIKIMPI